MTNTPGGPTATWSMFLSIPATCGRAGPPNPSPQEVPVAPLFEARRRRPCGRPRGRGSGLMVSEANAHRIVSDISMLSTVIDQPEEHRIIVAGDWNILRVKAKPVVRTGEG